MYRYLLAVVAIMGLFVSSSVLAKEKGDKKEKDLNTHAGTVSSVDLTAKTFVLTSKTGDKMTIKFTETTKFRLDKADSTAEAVLKDGSHVGVKTDATNTDTAVTVMGKSEKKDGDKKEGK